MNVTLDERLSMLAALTPACRMAADVGADHGFLGAWLLESGKCEHVQFCDISRPSLKKAYRLIQRLDLMDRASFSVGDGLDALTESAGAVIIAGMGGPTIAGIVERGKGRLSGTTLIMQPNVGAKQLRQDLMRLGFRIAEEALARSGGRWYVGIAAKSGVEQLTQEQVLAGPVLLSKPDPALKGYIAFRVRVVEKALSGAQKSDEKRAEELSEELAVWRGIEKCF